MTDLKLIALDAEDLAVLSAHLQDAVVRIEDMAWLPRQGRFAAMLSRFDWVAAVGAGTRSGARRQIRRRTALRFERVKAARVQNVDLKAKTQVLSLLAIQYEAATDVGGAITLVFAGGAAIRLEVECIEGEMRDLGGAWRARAVPDHGAAEPDVETSSREQPGTGKPQG
jgi:hypothetical protein